MFAGNGGPTFRVQLLDDELHLSVDLGVLLFAVAVQDLLHALQQQHNKLICKLIKSD